MLIGISLSNASGDLGVLSLDWEVRIVSGGPVELATWQYRFTNLFQGNHHGDWQWEADRQFVLVTLLEPGFLGSQLAVLKFHHPQVVPAFPPARLPRPRFSTAIVGQGKVLFGAAFDFKATFLRPFP